MLITVKLIRTSPTLTAVFALRPAASIASGCLSKYLPTEVAATVEATPLRAVVFFRGMFIQIF